MSHSHPPATPATDTLLGSVRSWWRRLTAAAHRTVGLPDYERYVAHCRSHHPDAPIPSYEQFFRERQAARYRRGATRCC